MIKLYFATILFCFPFVANADVSSLRTGWHAEFTRIVVSIPKAADWKLGKVEAGYGLRIDGVEGFELSGFFEKIPRQRIISARSIDPATLEIGVGCICNAQVFRWQPDQLVVDIYDGPPARTSPFEVALDDKTEVELPSFIQASLPPPRVTLDSISPLVRREAAPPSLAAFEEAIIGSISQASRQGLLDISDPDMLGAGSSKDSASSTMHPPTKFDSPEFTESEQDSTPPRLGIEVYAGGSFLSQEDADELALNVSAAACWPDEMVDIKSWTDGEDFATNISSHRSRIFGEFDRIDHDAVTDLARAYLYFGFGYEAIQTMSIDSERTTERVALQEIAKLLDGRSLTPNLLSEQRYCPGKVALWGFLAEQKHREGGRTIDHALLVRQFRRLPDHIQMLLGPQLAGQFLLVGEFEYADLVLVPAVTTEMATEFAQVQSAEVASAKGRKNVSHDRLADLVGSEADIHPETLIAFINTGMQQERELDAATFGLLEAARFQYRKTDVASDLAGIHIQALTYDRQFQYAIDVLESSSDLLAADERDELERQIFEAATQYGEDTVFLELAFSEGAQRLIGETSNAVAARLLGIGFPVRADEVLAGTAVGEPMEERRYLRAEAAMQLGDFNLAKRHLSGVNTDRAQSILRGEGAIAVDADPSTASWRSKDWSSLALGDDALFRDTSALVLDRGPSSLSISAPLADGRNRIEQSRSARETIESLMERYEGPNFEDG